MLNRLLGAGMMIAVSCSIAGAAAQDKPRLFTPRGAGPYPVALFVPGCSGFVSVNGVNNYEERARELNDVGYLVAFVDYLGRRGLKSCFGQVRYDAIGKDLIEAARWARTLPNADAKRIYAVGWSAGGGGVIAALAGLKAGDAPLTKVVLIYPDCRGARPWSAKIPVLVLLGALDDVAPPGECDRIAASAAPGMVKPVTYPHAHHAFDVRGLPEKTTYQFGTIGYNAAAAAAAKTEILGFLK